MARTKIPATLKKLAVPIDSVEPHPLNARVGDVDTIIESLNENGQYRPIVVSKTTGHILAGNHTWQAAKALKWRTIAATFVEADDLTERRILAVDNAASDRAIYDDAKLLELLQPLVPDLAGSGFTMDSMLEIHERIHANRSTRKPTTDPDSIPDPPARKPKSKVGDVWILGKHRLLVGDALDATGMDVVMGEEAQARLLFTDPPYNVDYEGAAGKIKNDHQAQEAFATFLEQALRNASRHLAKGAPFYICAPDGEPQADFRNAIRATPGLDLTQALVWAKHAFSLGRQDYQWQHEVLLYGWRKGAAHRWFGGRNKTTLLEDDPTLLSVAEHPDGYQLRIGNGTRSIVLTVPSYELTAAHEDASTVWRFDKPSRSDEHPTMKPVGLVTRAIENSTRIGDIVLDPFGGSGTTLIAAELSGRQCRMIELDPKFADVICERFQRITQTTPIRQDDGPVSFLGKQDNDD